MTAWEAGIAFKAEDVGFVVYRSEWAVDRPTATDMNHKSSQSERNKTLKLGVRVEAYMADAYGFFIT